MWDTLRTSMATKYTPPDRPAHLPPAPDALWDWIEKRRLNQREAARMLEIPFNTLNHYLHNRRRPGLARLQHLYEQTGIPIALWLPTRVGTRLKRRHGDRHTHQYLQTGNA